MTKSENKPAMTSEFNARMVIHTPEAYRPETIRLAEDYLKLLNEFEELQDNHHSLEKLYYNLVEPNYNE